MSDSKKTYLEILREKTEKENSSRMDDATFKKLLDAGEIGLIMSEGGLNLTKSQLKLVKEKAKEESDDLILKRQMKLATQPGYAESILLPLKKKILEESFNPKNIDKVHKEALKEAKSVQVSTTIKDKFAPQKINKVISDKKENKKTFKLFGSKKESPISSALSKPSFMEKESGNVLDDFVSFIGKMSNQKKEKFLEDIKFEQEQETRRETRHKEIMDVFLQATKKSSKAKKEITKQVKKAPPEKPAPEVPTKPAAPTQPPAPPAAPPPGAPPVPAKPPVTPPAAPAPVPAKPPTVTPAPPAPPVPAKPPVTPPGPPTKPPTVTPAPPAPPVPAKPPVTPPGPPTKPPTVTPAPPAPPTVTPAPKPVTPPKPAAPPVISEAVKTAAKVAIGATGIFAATDAFTKTMYPYAKMASEKLGGKIPPEAILGQWAGESGYGKSLGADFNYAGIKARDGEPRGGYVLTEEAYTPEQLEYAKRKGETLVRVLDENSILRKTTNSGQVGDFKASKWYASWYDKIKEGKTWVQVRSYFAKYNNLEDFTNAYVKVLSQQRYKKARESTDASTFGFEVAKAGYATAGAQKYSEKVAGFVKQNAELLGSLSRENADARKQMSQGQGAPVIVNSQINNNTNVSRPVATPQPNPNPMLGR